MNKLQRAIRRELISIYLDMEWNDISNFESFPTHPSISRIIAFVRGSESSIYQGMLTL